MRKLERAADLEDSGNVGNGIRDTVGNELDDESKNMDGNEEDPRSFDQDSNMSVPIYSRRKAIDRYNNSLRNLIPVRKKGKVIGTMPIDSAGLFSFITFSWVSTYMYKAFRTGITMEELPAVSPYDDCNYNADRLERLWKDELVRKGPAKASFSRVAWKFFRTRFFASCVVYTACLILGFVNPTVLARKLLEYVESEDMPYIEGVKWALLLTVSELLRALLFSWAWALNYRTALRLRSACFNLLYRKISRVNNLGNKSIGEVINMFSNDDQRIFDMVIYGSLIIAGPITTVYAAFYIFWLLGPMALIGMTAFVFFYPAQFMISRLYGYFQSEVVKISDMRVRLVNEILDYIKLIKMYAWEQSFSQDLLDIRKKERHVLLKTSYCQSLSVSVAPTIPVISTVMTVLAHISTGSNLTASQVFSYVSLLDSRFAFSLTLFQYGIEAMVSAKISFDRMKSVLLLEDSGCTILKPIFKSQAVAINHGTFACNTFDNRTKENSETAEKIRKNNTSNLGDHSEKEKLNKPTTSTEYTEILFDITFEAPKGKLIGICGHVGSGKSSLLLAALGQLRINEGQVMRDGSCAYVSQQAWITNASLRDNILFGLQFDNARYYKAIYASNLTQDINMMSGGDQEEIGENGVNLSGGQKQRVALARALYANRDIYFLDDPLSAVDARVGSFIFDNYILGALRGKTVLFVTHQIHYLNRCDDIYMMRDGKIIEHGTHDELMKLGNEYALMVAAISAESNTEETDIVNEKIEELPQSVNNTSPHQGNTISIAKNSSHVSADNMENVGTPGTGLTVAENLQQGTIEAHTYHSFITAAGGYFFCFIVIVTFFVSVGSNAFSSWWLATWLRAGSGNTSIVTNNRTIISTSIHDNPNFEYYRIVYAGMVGVIVLSSLLRSLAFTKATITASTNLHNNLFKKIITSPMRFFDTTPSGRIQHLFSRDMDEVDSKLPLSLTSILQYTFILFFAMVVICVVFPWFVVPLFILSAIYYFLSKIFRVAGRDLRRMENKSRAPVFSYVTATVQGLSTIHAFEKERDFRAKFSKIFDENSKCLFMCCVAMRWLAVRMDSLSVLITGITAGFVIALKNTVPAPLAGLALSYSAHIAGVFQYTIRLVSETEVRFISVERINHYVRTLEIEGSANQPTVQPPANWPSAAVIKFQNISMSYGEGAPLILKNVSFTVNSGEKIGIVGRTGSGKSSLTVALFRLVELAKGKIEIDDIDISKISLDRLRTKLSIIPQDPTLFSGTIRSNLDPFKVHTDAEIWTALEKTKLKNRVQSISGHLDASVGFGGDNLSVGERQLLCLTRALLRDTKILVLDEATAAVDPETELAVQSTIQQEFSECTILTIAHRLQTVLSLNRVLIMNDGKVLEFDTPSNLLSDESSEFSKMIAAAERAVNRS
ncbi:ATP-binding cassette sub-family C member 5 isoform X1 [Neodiprion lecontei]|uniref:ATP-binding cassette sub-family C member 5 isoform X1 n=3 Tax=Neodiprion lecontei TaxID=441921 RepID=A0A6J0C5T2_NEOLC|nr:ATP-binding cassette sub-family C member 5 isoform X1 [Neodiprion lecontei]XP_046586103.1 ATP-binding cassette sub-family C member 5 isoform X1 [Neodiprion lecontei]